MFRLAVQMDPIETMVVDRDTSLALMVTAQARGAEVWWFLPEALVFDRGRVRAAASRVTVSLTPGAHYQTLEQRVLDLGSCDVVLIRQDPPFDMAYVTSTYLLELLEPAVLVLNRPQGIRNIPEKLSTLSYADLTPPTLVGRDRAAITAFAQDFDQVVLKPAFLAGGDGVQKTALSAPDFNAVVDAMLAASGKEPIIVQAFLPGVKDGDKRVFALDGQAIGAVRRMPAQGEFRANLHVGGQAIGTDLDDRDRAIVARVAPLLAREGVLFAGLDVIDGRLTEINVTSPTLLQQLKAFSGIDATGLYWDAALKRLQQQRGGG